MFQSNAVALQNSRAGRKSIYPQLQPAHFKDYEKCGCVRLGDQTENTKNWRQRRSQKQLPSVFLTYQSQKIKSIISPFIIRQIRHKRVFLQVKINLCVKFTYNDNSNNNKLMYCEITNTQPRFLKAGFRLGGEVESKGPRHLNNEGKTHTQRAELSP